MLFTFLQHLDRARIRPLVVFFKPGRFEREVAALRIPTAVVPTRRLRNLAGDLGAIRTIARLLRREQPHLVLSWMAKAHLYSGSAARFAGLGGRALWWQHEVPNGHWIDRAATLLPAVAIGCSSAASATAQRHHRPHRPTFVVHPGIDDPVRTTERDRLALRASLRIGAGAWVVGTVGRLQPSKGQHRLIESLAALRRRGLPVHGLMVGGDAHGLAPGYEESLHQLARGRGIAEAVTFTGQVPDAAPYVQQMDVLVNASDSEPFGIVLLEGMALGVPVVAGDAAGPAEIIEPGRSGILTRARDDGALTDALEQLLSDRPLRQRLARAGRQRFLDGFTADRMTRQLEDQLEALAGR